MAVCCLNCGSYFGEEGTENFCSDKCEKEFREHLDKEMKELMDESDG